MKHLIVRNTSIAILFSLIAWSCLPFLYSLIPDPPHGHFTILYNGQERQKINVQTPSFDATIDAEYGTWPKPISNQVDLTMLVTGNYHSKNSYFCNLSDIMITSDLFSSLFEDGFMYWSINPEKTKVIEMEEDQKFSLRLEFYGVVDIEKIRATTDQTGIITVTTPLLEHPLLLKFDIDEMKRFVEIPPGKPAPK